MMQVLFLSLHSASAQQTRTQEYRGIIQILYVLVHAKHIKYRTVFPVRETCYRICLKVHTNLK